MSRCFPFPPPGYEKKAKIDGSDSLKKEKDKEKKHKKEEKDKQKGEGKEKKDKERSKEKHREKKDRKEKYKDNKDKKKVESGISGEKKTNGQPEYFNGENPGANNLHDVGNQDSKFVLELDRRIRDGDKATGNQMVQKIMVRDQRTCELPGRVVDSFGDKQKINCIREDDNKANGHRNKDESEGLKISTVPKYAWMGSRRVEVTAKPIETYNVEPQMEGKEKFKPEQNAIRGDKHKEKDGEEKSKSKDKDSYKPKDKEEKAKRKEEKTKRKEERAKRKEEKAKRRQEKARKKEEKARTKEEKAKEIKEFNHQQPKLEESNQDSIVACSDNSFQLLKENKDATGGIILSKRKELEINGVLHDDDIRPSKFHKPISTSILVVENGMKEVLYETAIKHQPNLQKVQNTVDIKEKRINGLIKAQESVVCSTRPPPAPILADGNANTSTKPPHPDSKYLDMILSVPKMELSDFDDQEWLFGSNSLQSTMVQAGSGNDGIPEVWAESLRIESADVTALPYVIPF